LNVGAPAVYAAILLGLLAGLALPRATGTQRLRKASSTAVEALIYPLVASAGLAAGSALSAWSPGTALAAEIAYYAIAPALLSSLLARLVVGGKR
jgi:hypothetical protein